MGESLEKMGVYVCVYACVTVWYAFVILVFLFVCFVLLEKTGCAVHYVHTWNKMRNMHRNHHQNTQDLSALQGWEKNMRKRAQNRM